MIPWFRRFTSPVHTIIVSTKTDQSIRGMLVDRNKQYLTLRPASIASTDEKNPGNVIWTSLDGDVVIPWDNIDFWQEGVEAQLAGLIPELY